MTNFQNQIVSLQISSSTNSFVSEKRFEKHLTIEKFKEKLELITGINFQHMKLDLFNSENQLVCSFLDQTKPLGFYPVEDFMRVHVTNTDPFQKAGIFEDVSKVEKFELAEEEYSKRTDSVRHFKEKNKIGRFAEDFSQKIIAKESIQEEKAKSFQIGDRCEISTKNFPPRRATIRYIGNVFFQPGFWVGVEYDEPVGKNDGTVEGEKYFSCPLKYGGFVKPTSVTVGDFPVEDLFGSEEEI